MRLLRRLVLMTLLPFLMTGYAKRTDLDQSHWDLYKSRFLTADGRIVDTGNGGVSHSEGQGTGLLLAAYHGDAQAFAAIWTWTKANLREGRKDALFSWRWDPSVDYRISDPNNATDGDLMIAWALSVAAQKWDNADYVVAAREIAKDIRTYLSRTVSGLRILAPGRQGFDDGNRLTINLSYALFPAFDALYQVDPHPDWLAYKASYRRLMVKAAFGTWRLPTDWNDLYRTEDSKDGWLLLPAKAFPPRFGHDAIRIPLYLSWGRETCPELCNNIRRFWAQHASEGRMPAWVDTTNDRLSRYDASLGFAAIRNLIDDIHSRGVANSLPPLTSNLDYYSSSLIMLAHLARFDAGV